MGHPSKIKSPRPYRHPKSKKYVAVKFHCVDDEQHPASIQLAFAILTGPGFQSTAPNVTVSQSECSKITPYDGGQ